MRDGERKTGHPVEDGERNEFEAVKQRLEEIADAVADEGLSLDDALDLYEEAVSLGLQASDLLEVGVDPDDGQESDDAKSSHPEGAAGDGAAVPVPQAQ